MGCSSGGIQSCRHCGMSFGIVIEADPPDLALLVDVLFDSEAYPTRFLDVLFEFRF